ncbi:MAG TPA: flagellar motor protein MotB [Nitrospirota bacterium]|nr:flagellar motor protein MotB [Nitrospirota bacterium]
MTDQKSKIVIKKVKKVVGGGAHGGSWKVAYADFVTAMMAFFLLLWLLSMVSSEKRIRIAAYFKHFSIFSASGTSFMEKSSEMFNMPGDSGRKVPQEMQGQGQSQSQNMNTPEQFKEAIKKAIEAKLNDIKDQIIVDVFEGGVRIQLVDKEGKPMFDIGSPKPTPMAMRIMTVVGEQIKAMPNAVSVEGHTDSLAYRTSSYGNWELSTERALSARKLLEGYGLNPSRLTRVAGYADTVPFVKEDPEDPRNRRISVILLFPEAPVSRPTGTAAPAPTP